MNKVYILILPPHIGGDEANISDRQEVIKYLKESGAIGYWEYCLPISIFFESSMSSKEISNLIEKKYGEINHIVVEVTKNYWGRLPQGYWDMFPKLS